MLGDFDQLGAAISSFKSGNIVYVALPTLAAFIDKRRGWAIAADVVVFVAELGRCATVLSLRSIPPRWPVRSDPSPRSRSSKEIVLQHGRC